MLRKIIFIASLFGFLSGCALPIANSAPTPYPANYLPTVIYLTAQSLNGTMSAQTAAAIPPSKTPTQTPVPPTLTPQPTPTFTPAPDVPLAAVQINAPGPMSKVASPLDIRVTVATGKKTFVEIKLYGEDGRYITGQSLYVPGPSSGEYLSIKMPFEIRAAAEVGILQVSAKDDHGNIQSLNTARILLMSIGVSQINPAGNGIYERVILPHLPARSAVSGGVVNVDGQFSPFNHKQVVLELVSDDGTSLVSRLLTFTSLDPQNFSTTLPYKVSAPTQARLFIRQPDDVLPGPVYIYSQQITLNP